MKHSCIRQLITTAILSMFVLTGCLGGSSPVVKYYVLNPLPDADMETGSKPLSVEISTIHLPQYLDRPHLVTRSSNNRLKILQSHQWGGNLRKDMVRTLAVNLSQLLDTPNVTIAPHRSSSQGDYRVSIEILKFEKDTDGRVKLSAQWQITSGIERTLLTTQMTTLSSDHPATEDNYEEVVAMMSNEYGELARVIASTIQQIDSNK
jgi:uncharacterized lipoprotein YmbA